MDARSFLSEICCSRREIDDWFQGKVFPFAHYDSGLGWVLADGRFKDGLDGSLSRYHYASSGERVSIQYSGQSCRINTYGNFFQAFAIKDRLVKMLNPKPISHTGMGT